MGILKLSKIVLMAIFLLLSCQEEKKMEYINDYISCGSGFWITLKASDTLNVNEVKVKYKNKELAIDTIYTEYRNTINLAYRDTIPLSDTLEVLYKNRKWHIYDFKNTQELVITKYPKKEIICRISTVSINGKSQKDNNDNTIVIDLEN